MCTRRPVVQLHTINGVTEQGIPRQRFSYLRRFIDPQDAQAREPTARLVVGDPDLIIMVN